MVTAWKNYWVRGLWLSLSHRRYPRGNQGGQSAFPSPFTGQRRPGCLEVSVQQLPPRALTAARFNHPNIIKVFDTLQVTWACQHLSETATDHEHSHGEYPLYLYVAEFIPDGIYQHFKSGLNYSAGEASGIAMQVCDALKVLHRASRSVLHRDLHPGNILLAEGAGSWLQILALPESRVYPRHTSTERGPYSTGEWARRSSSPAKMLMCAPTSTSWERYCW